MPIEVLCPSCRTPAVVPESAQGSKGKCVKCGGVVTVPYLAPKICYICTEDVSGRRRVKDDQGHYYCVECYRETAHERADTVSTGHNTCSVCQKPFALNQLLDNRGHPTCKDCFADQLAARQQQRTPGVAPGTSACPICRQEFATREMFNNGGRLMCRGCYLEMFTSQNEAVGAGGRQATPARAEAKPFWNKFKSVLKVLPRKCPACGKHGATHVEDAMTSNPGTVLYQCKSCRHEWEDKTD